ncbi:TfoX/Sxy family protein [Neomegalonema sp.]|uniref:TfoX/Sxy family protein n=1 Tax=Neomegalonema sp. TaxID=2039713 RepID=UPI002622DE08|nr:TfoX/Sxy family protein [Neomegalonema sp.]MDD2867128.1 TfoX/Sxy family protein [Neomegalonema sp.]
MSLDSEIARALELFADLDGVSARRMFGGAGLYKEGVMFALLAHEAVWLRADPEFAMDLEAEGSAGRFETEKGGGASHLPYWRLPEAALDDPEAAAALARRAWSVAVRLKTAAPSRAKKFPQAKGDPA